LGTRGEVNVTNRSDDDAAAAGPEAQAANWDGITLRSSLNDWALKARDLIADAARDGKWARMFEVLREHPQFVNATRPGGDSLFTPLHQAAHHGAPATVIDELVRLGAWRTLRNVRGERPVDTARRRGHVTALTPLTPVAAAPVAAGALRRLQEQFHLVIEERASQQLRENEVRLPELEPLTEFAVGHPFWFAVPGMYGGFRYSLEQSGEAPVLVTESWCRVVGGSGQRHKVTADGSRLVAEGFV
jgi:hypothetical protein